MEEITETDYGSCSDGCLDSSCDTMLDYIYGNVNGLNYSLASFWENTAGTFKGTNLWSNCAGFNSTNSTYVITTGSSITYGETNCCFDTGTGFNGYLNDIKINNCKIYCVGYFSSYNGTSIPVGSGVTGSTANIAIINNDGILDTTFISKGFSNGNLYSVELQSDGKIIVGGYFTTYSGVSKNSIVRLNIDGSIDNTFNIGTGFSEGEVLDMAIQSDGKILVVGGFTSYSGVSRNYIIRLNTDGSIDNTFTIGTGFNRPSPFVVEIQSDGKIVVGGYFQSYSGVSSYAIIRLNTNGSVDNTFTSPFISIADKIEDIQIQSDGKILCLGSYIVGSFIGTTIYRLNTNGTFDNTFVAPTGSTGQGSTAEVITLSNNSIFVGSTPIISGSLGKLNNVGSLLNC